MKFPLLFSSFLCLVHSATTEDTFLDENPSNLYDEEGNATGLQDQVGKAIITTKELEERKAEADRVAKEEAEKRAKEDARLARIAARKAEDASLPEKCAGYANIDSYKIASGSTLGKAAVANYGNSAYSTFISVINKKPANKLFIGETLKTPSPYQAFTEMDGKYVAEKYPYAIRDLLTVHEQIKRLKPTIIEQKAAGKYSTELKEELDEMIWTLAQVKQDFLDKVEGIDEYPLATMSQLQSAYNNLRDIRRGQLGNKNLSFTRVDIYLINCYSYAYAWGRDGFGKKAEAEKKK